MPPSFLCSHHLQVHTLLEPDLQPDPPAQPLGKGCLAPRRRGSPAANHRGEWKSNRGERNVKHGSSGCGSELPEEGCPSVILLHPALCLQTTSGIMHLTHPCCPLCPRAEHLSLDLSSCSPDCSPIILTPARVPTLKRKSDCVTHL